MAHILFFFFFFFFFVFFFAFAGAYTCDVPISRTTTSTNLPLMSVNNPCYKKSTTPTLSWAETVLEAQLYDKARVTYLSNVAATGRPATSGNDKVILQQPSYVVGVKIGIPNKKGVCVQTMRMAIDTSHGLALVPCSGCVGCPEDVPPYKVENSKTAKAVKCTSNLCGKVNESRRCSPKYPGCVFSSIYRSSGFTANLVQDNIVLGSDSISAYTFGCIKSVAAGTTIPSQGMLGLGRQSFSLLAQTRKLYEHTFSYCLPSYNSSKATGSLTLGAKNQRTYTGMKTTPLVRSSSLYSVNLMAIRFGKRIFTIPASSTTNTIGNEAVIDSATVYSVLEPQTYTALRNVIIRKMKKIKIAQLSLLGGFDTCYNVPMNLTAVTLMFSGMNLTLPEENVVLKSSSGHISCLAMSAAPKGTTISVIGTYQQQNLRVLFNVPKYTIGVVSEKCI